TSRSYFTSKGPPVSTFKSANATGHDLLAQSIVLEHESLEDFYQLLHDLMEEHHPTTFTQRMFVEDMTAANWRLNRTWSMQKQLLEHDVAIQDPKLPLNHRI